MTEWTDSVVLALDLWANLWVALYRPNWYLPYNELNVNTFTKVTPENIISKLKEFYWDNKPDLILVTNPVRFYSAISSHFKLIWVLEYTYWKWNIINIWNDKHINKALTGKGDLSKQDTIDYITNKWYHPSTEHEADAIKFILYYLNNYARQQSDDTSRKSKRKWKSVVRDSK